MKEQPYHEFYEKMTSAMVSSYPFNWVLDCRMLQPSFVARWWFATNFYENSTSNRIIFPGRGEHEHKSLQRPPSLFLVFVVSYWTTSCESLLGRSRWCFSKDIWRPSFVDIREAAQLRCVMQQKTKHWFKWDEFLSQSPYIIIDSP